MEGSEIYILAKINRPLVTLFLPLKEGSQSKKSNCEKNVEKQDEKKRTKINCWTVTLFLPTSQLDEDFLRTMALVMPSVGVGVDGRKKGLKPRSKELFLLSSLALLTFSFHLLSSHGGAQPFVVSLEPALVVVFSLVIFSNKTKHAD